MSKPFDTKQTTRYLLGSLSAEAADRFDELSVADEDFASALKTVESDLVDAYVHGELDDTDRKQSTKR